MITVPGHIITSLPIEGLERISNLIEFDGPLLSHYKDKFDNQYLYYWVDQDKVNNRWLVWKVNMDFLYLYINVEIPLLTLFPKSGEMLFCIDIDNGIRYSKIVLTYSNLIPENYLPEPDAYFRFEIPDVYAEQININSYLKGLRERALYFNVEPASARYQITVGIKDIWNEKKDSMSDVIEIPKCDGESHGPAWCDTYRTDESGERIRLRPHIRCICGDHTNIGNHHIHADGTITASYLHQLPDDSGCGWHVTLKMIGWDGGELLPGQNKCRD